jgi:O-antigen/teichoic acid export membrane protein
MTSSSIVDTNEPEVAESSVVLAEPSPVAADQAAPVLSPTMLGRELRTLAHHSSHYMAGIIANLALGLVSFPIFTRIFSLAEYGTMDLGQRILLLLTISSKAGIQNASLRFYDRAKFAAEPDQAKRYYSTLFLGVLSTGGMVALLFGVFWALFPSLISSTPVSKFLYLIVVLGLVRALQSVIWGFLRIEERTKLFNILSVTNKALMIAVVCALFPLIGRTAKTYFAGTLSIELLVAVGLSTWLVTRGVLSTCSFDFGYFRSAVWFGAPLVVYELAFGVLGSADRFLVRHYLGANSLGLYSAAFALANNVNELLMAPLNLALIPIYMRIWSSYGAERTSAFLTVALEMFIVISIGLLAIVAACSKAVVVLLASAKYAGAEPLIPIILAGLLAYAANVFVAAGLLIHKRTLRMAGLLVVAAVVNITLNCLLLPRIGLLGGAIATSLSYGGCILSLAWASTRLLPLHVKLTSILKCAVLAAAAWAISSRIAFNAAILEGAVRATVVFVAYILGLYLFDERVRHGMQMLIVALRNRVQTQLA